MGRALGRIVIRGIVTALVAGVVILLLPVALASGLLELARGWFFCWRHRGELYLVCSRRHGWHEMLVNNLLPGLPSNVVVLWVGPGGRSRRWAHPPFLDRPGYAKPYLAAVGWRRVRFASLNEMLRPWRRSGRRDHSTQRELSAVVAAVVSRLARECALR